MYKGERTRRRERRAQKERALLFRGPFPVYEALEAPAHPSSKPGLVFSLRLPHQLKREAKLLKRLLLFGLLGRFLLHSALQPGFGFRRFGSRSTGLPLHWHRHLL